MMRNGKIKTEMLSFPVKNERKPFMICNKNDGFRMLRQKKMKKCTADVTTVRLFTS